MKNVILVFIGSAFGGVLRYCISQVLNSQKFPWGTAAVNLAGSFLIGILVAFFPQKDNPVRALLGAGLLGGFTTFSTFSAETVMQIERCEYILAIYSVGLQAIGSVCACGLGLWLGNRLNG
jgi:CrcB protein